MLTGGAQQSESGVFMFVTIEIAGRSYRGNPERYCDPYTDGAFVKQAYD